MTQHLSMEAHASMWLEDEELTFPSYPRRFHRASDASATVACDSASRGSASSMHSDIESLLDRDDSLSGNADFWREVPAACEGNGELDAAQMTESSLTHTTTPLHTHSSMPLQESPLASPVTPASETCLEDFICDVGPSANTSSLLQTPFQPDFQIKRLCFRDAEGKLALTDSRGSVSKPSFSRHTSYKTSRKLLKRALRRKSGLWEMASPKFAVAEFMLL
ncbi:LAME_0E06084g1_1 [Lachancea meyersii CBS 8951]|uniref:LAME_0E06084g1_1 n=1 Tax=Lachancea meyersii CBS 8951 TaxID=1266667 RepID=A0A1G4JHT8_9SACH|nr:LAME_0E06084g1_1 [Lachancea meyersii CBS 8951]